MISTGIQYLDKITGGFKLGDNVVWGLSDGVSMNPFLKTFFEGNSDFTGRIIYISSNYSPATIFKKFAFLSDRNFILIDAFTHGKGNSDPIFLDFYEEDNSIDVHLVENPRDFDNFSAVMNGVERENRDGSFYIFDSLTGLYELWKDEKKVIDFFVFTCPKLYDLNTLAYWAFERDAHSREFVASITHITQIVFSLSSARSDFFNFMVEKMEGRPTIHDAEPYQFRFLGDNIVFEQDRGDEMVHIGEPLKELRKQRRITQAELASILGMTPGAVSQLENNITSPALQTLVQLSSVFNRPMEFFVGSGGATVDKGYRLFRMETGTALKQKDCEIQDMVIGDDFPFKLYLVTLPAESFLNGPIMLHKGSECVVLFEGELTVSVGDEELVLGPGDSLVLKTSFIESWKSSDRQCRFLYFLLL